MSEHINRERALEILNDIGGCGAEPGSYTAGWDEAINAAYEAIQSEPAADVAPVVRCKDCEHWGTRKADGYGFCCIWGSSVKEDSFCSSGVKEDTE